MRKEISITFLAGLMAVLAYATVSPPSNIINITTPSAAVLAKASVTVAASNINPTGTFYVIAYPTNTVVHHVSWLIDGTTNTTETLTPYCLFGDNGVSCYSSNLSVGVHIIEADVFSNATMLSCKSNITITVSAPVSTTPNAPSNLTAAALDSFTVVLNWVDNSNNETGFQVERMINGVWTAIAMPSVNSTTYTNTGLLPSTLYSYRVESWN